MFDVVLCIYLYGYVVLVEVYGYCYVWFDYLCIVCVVGGY